MFYTIYKTSNLLSGKFYIGKHQTENPYDHYFGSGKALKNAMKLHGKENFKKEVLFIFDNEDDMNAKEIELVTEELVNRSDTYNMGIGGEGGAHFKNKKHTDETKHLISIAAKNKIPSLETRAKISEGNRHRGPISIEGRQKIAEAQFRRREKEKLLRGQALVG